MSLKAAAFLFFVLATISIATSYVQVRKGDNQSDVDALIHKVIPSEDIEKFTNDARKRLSNQKIYKKKNHESTEAKDAEEAKNAKEAKEDNDLESIVFSIKTPEKNGQGNRMGGIIHKFFKFVKTFIMDYSERFSFKLQQFYINPKVVVFKSGKPSMLYQINVQGLIDYIKNYENSNMFKDQILNNRN